MRNWTVRMPSSREIEAAARAMYERDYGAERASEWPEVGMYMHFLDLARVVLEAAESTEMPPLRTIIFRPPGDRSHEIEAAVIPPARVLLCLGPCHGDFYMPLDLDEPVVCPNDPDHLVAVYSAPVIHAGREGF
jgi:hypothetical protein